MSDGFDLRDYQIEAVESVFRVWDNGIRSTMVVLPTGCHARGQGILMFDGSVKAVEDIVVGDYLMGPDSTPRCVLQLVRGTDEMFDVVPVKGKPWRVNGDHVLSLARCQERSKASGRCSPSCQGTKDGEYVDVTVREWMQWSKYKKHVHKLVRVAVEFPDKNLPLDLWLLGVILGDGSVSHLPVNISKPDEEIFSGVDSAVRQYGCRTSDVTVPGKCRTYSVIGNDRKSNGLSVLLRMLGLDGRTSGDKFIPEPYLNSSRSSRLQLLAGLMDTDGHLTTGGYDFLSKSHRMASEVEFVAKSVGLAVSHSVVRKGCQNGFTGVYSRLSISGDVSTIPVRVSRKAAMVRKQKKDVLRTGFNIVASGTTEEYFGFTVDGDHRYLLDDFTVTHNCGKTVVASSIAERLWERHHTKEDLYSGAILFLAHREELITQTHAKFRKHIPDAKIAIEMADYRAYGQLHRKPEIVIASTSSMLSRYKKYPKDYFGAAFVDECFPAGTLVDCRAIETIKPGDMVQTWNHLTNSVESRKVLRTSKRIPTEMFELFLRSGHKFCCTGDHPFYVRAPDGKTAYLPARSLSPAMDVMHQDGTWHPISISMKVAESLDGTFCGRCPDKFVYNLEVEHNHNYFVDGYLVHNCHHSVGKSYTEPLAHFNDNLKFLLGLTATPKRHDGKAMGRVFDEVAFKMTLLQAIDRGWILEPRIERISVAEMNLQNVPVVAGDLSKSSLSKEMSREAVIVKMVSETIIRAAGRQTAIYCVDVDHMRAVEQQLKQRGQTCGMIDGKTPGPVRKSKLRDFRERTIQFLISCGTLTEGWDCPECEVIAMFRPTQSCNLYEQIVGRGLRPLFPPTEETPELRRAAIAASEKPFCLVLDFVGNSRHKLANLGDILGGAFDDEVKRLAMDLARHETGPIDMRELLKRAEQILDEQRAKRFQKGEGRDKLRRALWQLLPHPYDVLGLDRQTAETAVSRDDAYGRVPIEAANTLEKYKFEPHEIKRLTNKEQVLLARVVVARSRRGQCSWKQAKLLYRFGYDANITIGEAIKVLDQVNAEDWWRPDIDGLNQRLVELAEKPENRWLKPHVEEEIKRLDKLNNVLPFV